jgi:sugar lactone lactonase YvrE
MFMPNGEVGTAESVEVALALGCDIGENPLWHEDAKRLFFVDIPPGTVYAYDPAAGNYDVLCRTRITGGFTLQQDGSLLLFQDGKIARLGLDGSLREMASGCCPGNDRFNDVIADPEGRVFAGAMGGNGRLLRLNPDGRITEIANGIGGPNGMGFTNDLRGMYFTDSQARKIYHFDYDRRTGNLSNRRTFAEIPPDEGLPDGMTVDAEGYVWSAIWFGGRLKRYAPDGRLDREILFPAKQISSVTFGGPELADIFITSAGSDTADSIRPPSCDPEAVRGGDLYRLRVPGVRGKLPFRSRIEFSN